MERNAFEEKSGKSFYAQNNILCKLRKTAADTSRGGKKIRILSLVLAAMLRGRIVIRVIAGGHAGSPIIPWLT